MSDSARIFIDVESGLGRVRGNKSLYKRMLGLFASSAEFQNFEDALASGDMAKSGDSAHTIKGMAGNLSLTAVFEDSSELMAQLRNGSVDDALLERYRDSLRQTLEQLPGVIESLQ